MTFLHWLRAYTAGYFWMRCEWCGQGFGGQQWKSSSQTRPKPGNPPGAATCAYCPECGDYLASLGWAGPAAQWAHT